MEDAEVEVCNATTILDVLAVWPCARAIFELVRVERVSRDWQHAVHDYLRSQRTLSFVDLDRYLPSHRRVKPMRLHRVIKIYANKYSWPNVNRTLVKFGSSIVKLITNCCEEEFFEAIATNCPYLQYVEFHHLIGSIHLPLIIKLNKCEKLKYVTVIDIRHTSDHELGVIFQNIDCEKIKVVALGARVTGSFLKTMKSSNLQSLRLKIYNCLNIHDLHSSVHNLRSLTCLRLYKAPSAVLTNIHLLLNEMPKLEELFLRYYCGFGNLSEEVIESFGRLANLKRLDMAHNSLVSDALLEELARGCGKLEYLNLCGRASNGRAAGLAALCCTPSVLAKLNVAYMADRTREGSVTFEWFPPVIKGLDALGCVKLSSQLLDIVPSGRCYPFELRAGATMKPEANHNRELKIILAQV